MPLRKCAKCGFLITKNGVFARGKYYHPEHMTCHICNIELKGKNYVKGKHFYCPDHYYSYFCPRCWRCGWPIKNEGVLTAKRGEMQRWHTYCFCCHLCGFAIGTRSYKLTQSGYPLCEDCFIPEDIKTPKSSIYEGEWVCRAVHNPQIREALAVGVKPITLSALAHGVEPEDCALVQPGLTKQQLGALRQILQPGADPAMLEYEYQHRPLRPPRIIPKAPPRPKRDAKRGPIPKIPLRLKRDARNRPVAPLRRKKIEELLAGQDNIDLDEDENKGGLYEGKIREEVDIKAAA